MHRRGRLCQEAELTYPTIIQGGMGVAVSSWPLARAVSLRGQLGVVSGTGLDTVMVRRLQLGDPGNHLRRAFDHFPLKDIAERVWQRYFIQGGKRPQSPFKSKPVPAIGLPKLSADMIVLGAFVEVFLAKEGHEGQVGFNLLEKIQIPTLHSLLGAMMAKVDYVLMGAGIPRAIPAALDAIAELRDTELQIDVAGALPGETYSTKLSPKSYAAEPLHRPQFLAIVSSSTLAMTLARKSTGTVNGFIVEGPSAGGHNAPPRGGMRLTEAGEPIYGPRDEPDLQAIRDLGLPFWMAGSYGFPGRLQDAIALGATGIQVGTPFAFCEESGMEPALKRQVLQRALEGGIEIFTDGTASPTAFPFKVALVPGTLSDANVYARRERICDMGYLRQPYRRPDGKVGYRCGAEPVEDFLGKGGAAEETIGRKCLCNGLLATVGLGQIRANGYAEPPIVTAGDALRDIALFVGPNATTYTAADVIDRILVQQT